MQNRYAGDIGDYLKLTLLRALSDECRLGVAWWLVPDESHNSDGRHITFLDHPATWRGIDPELFDSLEGMVRSGARSVASLEALGGLAECQFASAAIPMPNSYSERPTARSLWFQGVLESLSGCDLIFVDPDNGLEPVSYSPFSAKSRKAIRYAELRKLSEGRRTVIAYHHQTRRKGGHLAEVEYLAERLRGEGFGRVDAIRAKPYSPRVFFMLNASETMVFRAAGLAKRHPAVFSWHPQIVAQSASVPAAATARGEGSFHEDDP